MVLNSLRCSSNFESVISEHVIQFMSISCEIVLRWMPQMISHDDDDDNVHAFDVFLLSVFERTIYIGTLKTSRYHEYTCFYDCKLRTRVQHTIEYHLVIDICVVPVFLINIEYSLSKDMWMGAFMYRRRQSYFIYCTHLTICCLLNYILLGLCVHAPGMIFASQGGWWKTCQYPYLYIYIFNGWTLNNLMTRVWGHFKCRLMFSIIIRRICTRYIKWSKWNWAREWGNGLLMKPYYALTQWDP